MIEKTSIAFGKAVIKDSEEAFKNILEILAENQCFGQAVRQECIASEAHIAQAIEQTQSAFANGSNFAKRKELELLLMLSGKKQFLKAIGLLGLKNGKQDVAVIAVGENSRKAVKEIKDFLFLKEHKFKPGFKQLQKLFEIPEKEATLLKSRKKSIENAVKEKCALLELED